MLTGYEQWRPTCYCYCNIITRNRHIQIHVNQMSAMETYMLMLLVDSHQEQAIRCLFQHKGWAFHKSGQDSVQLAVLLSSPMQYVESRVGPIQSGVKSPLNALQYITTDRDTTSSTLNGIPYSTADRSNTNAIMNALPYITSDRNAANSNLNILTNSKVNRSTTNSILNTMPCNKADIGTTNSIVNAIQYNKAESSTTNSRFESNQICTKLSTCEVSAPLASKTDVQASHTTLIDQYSSSREETSNNDYVPPMNLSRLSKFITGKEGDIGWSNDSVEMTAVVSTCNESNSAKQENKTIVNDIGETSNSCTESEKYMYTDSNVGTLDHNEGIIDYHIKHIFLLLQNICHFDIDRKVINSKLRVVLENLGSMIGDQQLAEAESAETILGEPVEATGEVKHEAWQLEVIKPSYQMCTNARDHEGDKAVHHNNVDTPNSYRTIAKPPDHDPIETSSHDIDKNNSSESVYGVETKTETDVPIIREVDDQRTKVKQKSSKGSKRTKWIKCEILNKVEGTPDTLTEDNEESTILENTTESDAKQINAEIEDMKETFSILFNKSRKRMRRLKCVRTAGHLKNRMRKACASGTHCPHDKEERVKYRWTVNRNMRMHSYHRKCNSVPPDLDTDGYSDLEKGFYCPDCKYIFNGKNRLIQHKTMKRGYCLSNCIYCDADELKDVYQCVKCPKCFQTKEMLDRHAQKHNFDRIGCHVCGVIFYTAKDLRFHIKSEHADIAQVAFLCDLCGSKFKEKKVLNAHRRFVHSEARPESCSSCEKSFKTKSQLKNHLVIHKKVSDLNLSCEVCGKMFMRVATLKDHVRRHKKDFTHFCTVCNKGFYRKYGLDEHMRVHTGDKPFDCTLCDFKCALSCNLVKHMKVHQKHNVVLETGGRIAAGIGPVLSDGQSPHNQAGLIF